MASTDARPVPLKNVAFRVSFPIVDADGDLVTGATGLDSEVSKDAGAFADCTNEATEIGSSGMYYLDLTATEMNSDTVIVIVQTSSAGAKTSPIVMYPAGDGSIPVNVKQVNGTAQTAGDIVAAVITNAAGTDVAADIIAVKTVVDAILVDTGTTLDAALAVVDANVDAILVDTGTTLDAALAVVDANVDAILVDTGTTLDAAIADLPTNAELAAGLAALNDLDATAIQAAVNAALEALGLQWLVLGTGTVIDLGNNTTTTFDATMTGAGISAAHSGNVIVWTSGANAGIAKSVLTFAWSGSDASFVLGSATPEKLPTVPSAGDTFVVTAIRSETMRGTNSAFTASSGATLQTSVDDLPTNAELATALGTADDAVLAAVAAVQADTDDIQTKIGTPAGVSVSADIAAVKAETASIQTDTNSIETKIDTVDTNVDTLVTNVAAILDDTGTTGVVLTAAERTAIAEAHLKIDMGTITGEAARSPLNALRTLRNKQTIVGTALTVYEEDDTTIAYTATLTTDAAALPITASDPT
jgi:hypothetical protein